jgi:hypothetical protein
MNGKVSILGKAGNLWVFHRIQIDSGAHPFFSIMITKALSTGVKLPVCETDSSPACNAELMNEKL